MGNIAKLQIVISLDEKYFFHCTVEMVEPTHGDFHSIILMYISVSRVVEDSGAVLTIETTRNSELIDTIFKKFALKMVELSCIKGLANNCQNKTSL